MPEVTKSLYKIKFLKKKKNQVLRNRKTMPVISQWARESKLLPALIPKMDSSE